MRKLIVLLVAVAFCVGVVSSPALALDHDPFKEWPHIANGGDTPDGDDGGWNDPHQSPGPVPSDCRFVDIFGHHRLCGFFWLVLSLIEHDTETLKEANVVTNDSTIRGH